MPMPSLALLLHITNLSLRLEPYACLHLSHAGIEKMAARATHALCAAERRKLLQQMFMLPVSGSVEQVELFVAQVEEEGPEGGAAAGVWGGGGHALRALGEARNAVAREMGPSLVEPLSLKVAAYLSQIRADASLPLCFVQVC